jgi:hypothetical protein
MLVDAADRGDVAEVRRLMKKGISVSELDALGRSAMFMAVGSCHTPVVECLIKKGSADIDGAITMGPLKCTTLAFAAMRDNYPLVQWLIEKGAKLPTGIWKYLESHWTLERTRVAELSSLLKVLTLLPISPDHDRFLPAFVARLLPQHAELCTRGRQLRARLPAYLEQQRASICTHCLLPAVLQDMVTAYALPTPEDLWSYGLPIRRWSKREPVALVYRV